MVIALISGLACGCAAPSPLETWQARVREYVQTAGHGDPHVLRTTVGPRSRHELRPARITVGVTDVPMNAALFAPTCDVHGLLLGHRRIGNQGWYAFLVAVVRLDPPGVVNTERVGLIEDMRLVALCAAPPPNWAWVIGPPNADARRTYLQKRAATATLESARASFPGTLDDFRLTNVGDTLIAREVRSGALWRLPLKPGSTDAAAPLNGPITSRRPVEQTADSLNAGD